MRMQAFSTVGTYGATVVHEVLQPLTALRFGLENLESHLVKNNSDQESKVRLDAVRKPAEKAIGVIESLRNFMVERNIDVKPVMLNEVLKNVVQLHQARGEALRASILIQSTVVNGYVLADEHQLERVLFNIINNALDAIELKNQSSNARNIIVKIQHIQQKQFVLLKIIDSGDGIPEGQERHIFDWMETQSGGMGVGLALSKMLVESWQGSISAYSADANLDGLSGAVFELKLKSTKL
jgi:C4-dicarboxylate-specific signal transduction histidine kinase